MLINICTADSTHFPRKCNSNTYSAVYHALVPNHLWNSILDLNQNGKFFLASNKKFMFSMQVTKIWCNFTVWLWCCSNFKARLVDLIKFCGVSSLNFIISELFRTTLACQLRLKPTLSKYSGYILVWLKDQYLLGKKVAVCLSKLLF